MSRSADSGLVLADVTEAVLADLLALALADTDPDEVTPPRGVARGWNSERISWFRAYHRAAAAGLDGPAAEKTWAIYCNGEPAGSVRLRRTGSGSLETGIWLARSMRGRGIGSEALLLLKDVALAAGADSLVAETTAGNRGALSLLRSVGAEFAAPHRAGTGEPGDAKWAAAPVIARIRLH